MASALQYQFLKPLCKVDVLRITSHPFIKSGSLFSHCQTRKWSELTDQPYLDTTRVPGLWMKQQSIKIPLLQQSTKIPSLSPLVTCRTYALSSFPTHSQPLLVQSNTSLLPVGQCFHTSSWLAQENKAVQETPKFGEQMTLRLINENGFLSWTRNSYLSAAVAVGMLNGTNDDLLQGAGVLVLLVSAMNMAWGSSCHFTNLLRIRHRITMSTPILFLNLLGTVLHALLWLFTIGFYLKYWGRKYYQKPIHPNGHHHHHHHHPEASAPLKED